jgi:hypothetical protein
MLKKLEVNNNMAVITTPLYFRLSDSKQTLLLIEDDGFYRVLDYETGRLNNYVYESYEEFLDDYSDGIQILSLSDRRKLLWKEYQTVFVNDVKKLIKERILKHKNAILEAEQQIPVSFCMSFEMESDDEGGSYPYLYHISYYAKDSTGVDLEEVQITEDGYNYSWSLDEQLRDELGGSFGGRELYEYIDENEVELDFSDEELTEEDASKAKAEYEVKIAEAQEYYDHQISETKSHLIELLCSKLSIVSRKFVVDYFADYENKESMQLPYSFEIELINEWNDDGYSDYVRTELYTENGELYNDENDLYYELGYIIDNKLTEYELKLMNGVRIIIGEVKL